MSPHVEAKQSAIRISSGLSRPSQRGDLGQIGADTPQKPACCRIPVAFSMNT